VHSLDAPTLEMQRERDYHDFLWVAEHCLGDRGEQRLPVEWLAEEVVVSATTDC
jgi:hypothetical protein